ncbi:DUF6603 domain-containing protein [Catellatospora tritici]|uniref:DUF6603 domain-containing protein n=1 Tax=Catellatospora tritici TaxID=2851566 RepID=UPI001C2D8935|nr:DUF6603 domain-containing protein [Catellatospora tritici]MBV1856283.1 hypothetical protein [Catellatospora tritici]
MTVGSDTLGSFGDLAKALGIVAPDGSANASWFGDPVGGSGNEHGLRDLMADDDQRRALLGFVDEILGPPEKATRGGQTWVPLFAEADPHVTVFAVVEEFAGYVVLGAGLEHDTSGGAPRVATRVHVPMFRFVRDGGTVVPDDSLPGWLVLGRPGGRISVGVEAVFTEAAPPPRAASLGGLSLTLGVPTATGDDLSVAVELRDLQLPGAGAPRTFTLDAHSLDELGSDVFELVVGLVRAQADALDLSRPELRAFAAVAGLAGLRDVPGLPGLPLADLPTAGIGALVGWVEDVLSEEARRRAWLGQLALLIDGGVNGAGDAVTKAFGPALFSIGVRVQPGTGGHPVLVPWVELALQTQTGVRARLAADLLRADTGTGAVTALPDARLEAVFGADAGGTALLPGTDPHVGSLHTGVRLDATGRPAFTLTLHDVTVAGRTHALLDLSSPQAAVEAAEDVVEGAIASAIAALGPFGAAVNRLLGLDPPAGVTGLDVTALLADPLAEVMRYWRDLTAAPAAITDVLGHLRHLITGAPVAAVLGAGTGADPWRMQLAAGIDLLLSRTGDVLAVDLAGSVRTQVLTDFEAAASVGLSLLRLDLAARTVVFAAEVRGTLSLARADAHTARLDLAGLSLELDRLAATVSWAAGRGLRGVLAADGLAVVLERGQGLRVPFALPTIGGDGRLVLPAPDWDVVERVLAALLAELRLPAVDAIVGLLGWNGRGAHLSLGGLLGADPTAAVEAWLADLILDCGRVRAALGPVAALLSGWRITAPYGSGTARSPYRCPVAGEPRAPGLAVWLDPGCAPVVGVTPGVGHLTSGLAPESATVVSVLHDAAYNLPDVADLLVGRDSLASGFDLLTARWAGTDGLVGQPSALPDGVTGTVLDGLGYAELVAAGGAGLLVAEVVSPVPQAVVHVGCEQSWTEGRPDGTVFDRSAADAPQTGSIPATGDGTWFVRLPAPAAAAAARPDRGGVGEQAARLAAVLAGRTESVTVVAYGACGAAAIRAAAGIAMVHEVITVGAPWSAVAVDSLQTGLGGDALRLLHRLRRTDAPGWPEVMLAHQMTAGMRVAGLVERSAAPLDLPSAAAEARRSDLSVRAVFGATDAESLAHGLGAYVADGISARLEAAAAAEFTAGPVTALHAGVDLPVIDLNIGGLLVGVGATVELCRIGRAGGGLSAQLVRGVIVDVHLGVHDGWLLGGPGTSGDPEVRWMSARVEVPLDGRPGDAELVLHEARGLGIDRERWVVRADPAGAAFDVTADQVTGAVPEVRVLVGGVLARLRAASADLAALLDLLGVVRAGGLDPDGLDRLLHDTAATVRAAVAAAPADVAAHLRALVPGCTGTGAALDWTIGPATVGFDLAAGGLDITWRLAEPGVPLIEAAVALTGAGASATVSLGELDPHTGGLRLVGRTAPGAAVEVQWAAPNAATRTVALLPVPDAAGLRELATVAVPAVTAQALLTALRRAVSAEARPALDLALDAVGLLTPADASGGRDVVVPVGLVADPGGWLRQASAGWRSSPAASAVALLDALAPLVVPGRGSAAGWPLADGVTVSYGVAAGDRLRLMLDVALHTAAGGTTVTTHLSGGLLIGADGLPQPAVSGSVDIDGRGLRLSVDPGVRLELLRPAPAAALTLYPDGPGLGQALSAIGGTVLPPVLDALAAHRGDLTASVLRDVGHAVYDLGGALDLRQGTAFSGARIEAFAADPAAALTARLPQLITAAVASLANALDPGHTLVTVSGPVGSVVTLGFGTGQPVHLTLDASGPVPAVELRADVAVAGVGHFVVERLRLSTAGVDVAVRIGPILADVGPFALRPLLLVRAGSAAGGTRLAALGLALDDAGTRSVQVRWALDASAPALAAVTAGPSGETVGDAAQAALWLLAQAVSLAGGVAVHELRTMLTPRAIACLQGVVFTDTDGSTQIDPGLALDLLEPEALLGRLKRLLWNAAAGPGLVLTIDGIVTVGITGSDSGSVRALGVNISLAPGRRFTIADGDTKVELEVDASWVHATVAPGLTVYVLSGTSAAALQIAPAVSVSGLGLRFTKTTGPLLSMGAVSLDGIAVHVYGEAAAAGIGGGVQVELAGLAISPAGAGGGNGVANGILSDSGSAGQGSRPAFSPALAIQQRPGHSLEFSLRAGPPPGPWWLVVQRQLGPLYLERIGFDTVETGGTVSRISLMFDGRVSIFGLTAAVDRLSLSWLGGDVLDIHSWAADLMGLAVSADLSGVSLAGGMLKTVGPPENGPVSYVGMLLGRFGVYGLSVFGGYTDDSGNPSFFVFGALNGPIGGPPAFFLTGIGGGLGINRGLRIPDDVTRFAEFPFIQALDPAAQPPADPMAELRRLTDYFPPQRGNFWFAAGISFNSFSLVDGIAVIAVSFGDGLEIDLLGLARMALPRPQAALVSIELGLLARFSTREGLFIIRAALTENSWLLYPEVRLTGGFAFATWWKGPLSGQFVLTLGGYHPDFHRDGYPEVARLGLMWRITDEIVIKGGSYFALTSEALMAGVDVEVSADFGWAWARIAFGAHGIVYFDPFWFEVMAYARISAGIKIDTFLGTISFSISLGAQVKVWGPDFSGEATLEVGPCSFTVGFGSEHRVEPRTLHWDEFVAKYLEDAGGGRARALSAITGAGSLPAATGGDRAAPTPDGSSERPFEVYAEFELTVVTTVPTTAVDVGLPSGQVPVRVTRSDGAVVPLGLKPMKAADLASVLAIRLEQHTSGGWVPLDEPLRQLGANLAASAPTEHGSNLSRDAFPIGAWGQPELSGTAPAALPQGDVINAGNQVKLVAEAQSLHRGPEIDYYRVEASRRPLPLQASGPDRGVLLSEAATVVSPTVASVAQALDAAQAQLFAAPAATADGLLPTGARSALARASYRGEVAAPPLFGTLADGLAVANGADAAAARVAPPPPPAARVDRAPIVAGYLTAGPGAAARAAITTVADREPPRRVAPTLDAARVRLATQLPVELHLAAAPSVPREGTLVAASVPRTVVPGTTRSYGYGTAGLSALVGGLSATKPVPDPRAPQTPPGTSLPDPGPLTHVPPTQPGKSHDLPGKPDHTHGKPHDLPGRPDSPPGKARDPHGTRDDRPGNAHDPHGGDRAAPADRFGAQPGARVETHGEPGTSARAAALPLGRVSAHAAVPHVPAQPAGRESPPAQAQAGGQVIGSGDLVVLTFPDASTATGGGTLNVSGRARVAILNGGGDVLADADAHGPVPVPATAALVAVQADGTTTVAEGLAGWHSRSRLCALGGHAALAAGCVLTSDGLPTGSGIRWSTAADLLDGTAASLTRFSGPVRTVAIAVEAADAERLDGLALQLTGALRARDARGELPPTVVHSGGQSVLLYAVEPGSGPVGVRVRAGGDWRVTGVLGSGRAPAAIAAILVRHGLVAATARLLTTGGDGCRITWTALDQQQEASHDRR